jgi:hypothetical protein
LGYLPELFMVSICDQGQMVGTLLKQLPSLILHASSLIWHWGTAKKVSSFMIGVEGVL